MLLGTFWKHSTFCSSAAYSSIFSDLTYNINSSLWLKTEDIQRTQFLNISIYICCCCCYYYFTGWLDKIYSIIPLKKVFVYSLMNKNKQVRNLSVLFPKREIKFVKSVGWGIVHSATFERYIVTFCNVISYMVSSSYLSTGCLLLGLKYVYVWVYIKYVYISWIARPVMYSSYALSLVTPAIFLYFSGATVKFRVDIFFQLYSIDIFMECTSLFLVYIDKDLLRKVSKYKHTAL